MAKSYVSSAELDELGEGLIQDYQGKGWEKLTSVDIEGFIQDYLKLPIEYASFAEDEKDKIGFISDGFMPLKVYQNQKIVEVCYPKGTIVLDCYLRQERESSRRRFTLAHEAGHFLFDRMNPMQSAASFHEGYDEEREYTLEELAERFSMNEWQADKLAAALLMPKFVVKQALNEYAGGKPIPVYGDNVFCSKDKAIIRKMAEAMGVSFTALLIRLRNFRMLEYHEISEYIKNELRLGGV